MADQPGESSHETNHAGAERHGDWFVYNPQSLPFETPNKDGTLQRYTSEISPGSLPPVVLSVAELAILKELEHDFRGKE